jgi:hypothetical protein
MTKLSEHLQLVINDCQIMAKSIESNSVFDMWDVNDLDNWDGMVDILSKVKERLDILEEQNSLMWKKQA